MCVKKLMSVMITFVVVSIITIFFVYKDTTILVPNEDSGVFSCASLHGAKQTTDELLGSADAVIIGRVVSEESEKRFDMVFTRSYVEVEDVKSGCVNRGDILPVLQTGGNYDDVYTPFIDGVVRLESDKMYALVLRHSDYSKEYGQYYLIIGGPNGICSLENYRNTEITNASYESIFKLNAASAGTNTPTFDYYWNKSSLAVYVQPNIRDRYHSNTRTGICNGINSWANQTDSPSTSITISTASADACAYMYDYGDTGWDAYTTTYYTNNICDYSRLQFNAYYLGSYASTTNLWCALACHEFGHTLGLDHNESGAITIMREYTEDYYNVNGSPKRYNPQTADKNSINAKY